MEASVSRGLQAETLGRYLSRTRPFCLEGSPAIFCISAGRPEALRPRLSTGLPTVHAQLMAARLTFGSKLGRAVVKLRWAAKPG